MKVKGNTNIVQANFLLENRPKFTKDETRLFLTILGSVNKDDEDFKPLEIPVSEFADLWGIESNAAYRKIKEALHGLVKKDFFIEGINKRTGKMRFLAMSYLSMATYEEGEGYATVEISPTFKPYLLALKQNYTKYVLNNILQLTTVNAIRNYELLKQYETLGNRKFTIDEYKKMLAIEDKYALNADLRRYVLEPAIAEINANTDIFVSYKLKGRGKKATIDFTIHKNDIKALPQSESEIENQMLLDDFTDNSETNIADERDRRNEICFGFEDEIFDEFTDDQLKELRSLAWNKVDPEEVEVQNSIFGNLKSAKEFIVSSYIRTKILMCNAKGKKVKHRYSYIKKAVNENWE